MSGGTGNWMRYIVDPAELADEAGSNEVAIPHFEPLRPARESEMLHRKIYHVILVRLQNGDGPVICGLMS